MIYSVWNQGVGDFEYFKDSKVQHDLNVEKPEHIKNRALGSTVNQAAWPLPSAVTPIGRGPSPIGRVASSGGGESLGADDGMNTTKVGLLLLAGLLVWKYVVPKKRAR